MIYGGGINVPGAAGNIGGMVAGGPELPFGTGARTRTFQEQYRPGAPRDSLPIRVFPQNEPGREGAINVPFQQAFGYGIQGMMPGMPGNFAGMANAQFYGGPQMGQVGPEQVVAANQGPSTPVKYDEQMRQFVPNPGAGRPGNVRLKNPPFV